MNADPTATFPTSGPAPADSAFSAPPEFTDPSGRGARTPLVLLAGVPGAGKTQTLRALRERTRVSRDRTTSTEKSANDRTARRSGPGAPIPPPALIGPSPISTPGRAPTPALRQPRIADPERIRDTLQHLLPGVPYSVLRPFVHVSAHVRAFALVSAGPGVAALMQAPPDGTTRPLLVHDPGTRRWTRAPLLLLALARGWDPVAIFIDVDCEVALAGQHRRGRVVRRWAFDRHWNRWVDLRARILAGEPLSPGENWPHVRLVSRTEAVGAIEDALARRSEDRSAESMGGTASTT